MALVRSENALD